MDFVKSIIDNWDPIGLLFYAPNDEYHSEICEIQHLLKSTDNYLELAEGIYNVFVESFGKEIFVQSKEECELIAKTLLYQKN